MGRCLWALSNRPRVVDVRRWYAPRYREKKDTEKKKISRTKRYREKKAQGGGRRNLLDQAAVGGWGLFFEAVNGDGQTAWFTTENRARFRNIFRRFWSLTERCPGRQTRFSSDPFFFRPVFFRPVFLQTRFFQTRFFGTRFFSRSDLRRVERTERLGWHLALRTCWSCRYDDMHARDGPVPREASLPLAIFGARPI